MRPHRVVCYAIYQGFGRMNARRRELDSKLITPLLMNLPKAHSDTYGYGPRQQMAYALRWGEWCNNHVLEKNETTSCGLLRYLSGFGRMNARRAWGGFCQLIKSHEDQMTMSTGGWWSWLERGRRVGTAFALFGCMKWNKQATITTINWEVCL